MADGAKGRGRRPGDSGTRDAIAAAARELFSERGFDRTTMRAIAERAGVDAALISYFFGSKRELFSAVVELPYDVAALLPAVLGGGPREQIGERLARAVVANLWSTADAPTAMLRTAAADPAVAALIREAVVTRLRGPFTELVGGEDAELRATLVGVQIAGLIVVRHIVGVPPLGDAELDPEHYVRAMAPVFQRLMTEPLG